MSYCRFVEGDMYMYRDVEGMFVCCACRLNDEDQFGLCDSVYCETAHVAKHLRKHKKAVHIVPKRAGQMLWQELRIKTIKIHH